MESIKSKVYLPYVNDPIPTLKNVAEFHKQYTAQVNADGELTGLDIDAVQSGSFIFIELAGSDEETSSDVIVQHDQFIKKFLTELSTKIENIVAIYTGEHSPVGASTQSRHVRQAPVSEKPAPPSSAAAATPTTAATTPKQKQTPEEEKEQTFFTVDNRVLIIFESVIQGETEVKMDAARILNVTEDIIPLEISGSGQRVGFLLTATRGNWNLINLTYNDVELYIRHPITVNLGLSYHCAQSISYFSWDRTINLTITGLQLQPTFVQNANLTAFGDADDCVGFTSGGIWGGLFVTLLLLSILTIGISWMMDIKTMDKFDDPKGKTIIVNVTD